MNKYVRSTGVFLLTTSLYWEKTPSQSHPVQYKCHIDYAVVENRRP